MKFVININSVSDYLKLCEVCEKFSFDKNLIDIIVSFYEINRFSELNIQDLNKIVGLNQKNKMNLILEWDLLSQESLFLNKTKLVSQIPLHEFKAIRVQDPGAFQYILENYPWLKIHLILENGNHNYIGLKKWCEFGKAQLERLVLSNELSKEHLTQYSKDLGANCEVLAFGRILLFYSPRKLLSPLEKNIINENLISKNIEAFGTSEESPHSGFPLIENEHGTFMFNVKDLFLVDHTNELQELGVNAIRYDLRFDHTFELLEKFMLNHFNHKKLNKVEIDQLKQSHARPFIKGFYNINKTDILFPKLKNSRIQRQDQNYLGEVVDVERDQQIALVIKSHEHVLKNGSVISFVTPEGKKKVSEIKLLKNTLGNIVDSAKINDIVCVPYMSGVVPKTQVYITC